MDRKEERRTEETAAFFSPSFVHRNGRLYHDPSPLPLFIRTRIPPARFVATPQLRSRPPLQRTWRNEPTTVQTNQRTNGWMDGWTDGISQGPFCTTFSCFFFGWTSDELVRGSRRGRTEGKRSEKEERTEARPWRKGRRERERGRERDPEGFFNQRILIDLQLSGVTAAT